MVTKNETNRLPATNNLLLERDGSVITIWLNRPDSRNALSAPMADDLMQVMQVLGTDDSLRVIILRGKGGYFCAGGDIKEFQSSTQGEINHQEVMRSNRAFGHLMEKINEQPQVVIVLVEGAAIGGGLGIVCVSDVAIVTQDAKFRLSETSLGIPPAQIAPFIVERIGLTNARRLMLTGARFTGQEAVKLGVAHYMAKDKNELESLCDTVVKQIKCCAPGANAATKTIIFNSLRHSRSEALDFAATRFADCMLGKEGREGIQAFIEKRKAKWVDDKS